MKPDDGADGTAFEILHHDDRGLTVRDLTEGHEYSFYPSSQDGGGPELTIGHCRPAAGRLGMDHFMGAAFAFAQEQAKRLQLI